MLYKLLVNRCHEFIDTSVRSLPLAALRLNSPTTDRNIKNGYLGIFSRAESTFEYGKLCMCKVHVLSLPRQSERRGCGRLTNQTKASVRSGRRGVRAEGFTRGVNEMKMTLPAIQVLNRLANSPVQEVVMVKGLTLLQALAFLASSMSPLLLSRN